MSRQILVGVCGIILGVFIGFLVWGDVNFGHTQLTCPDGSLTDAYGCCNDEVYTDMQDLGFNCCPPDGESCFPPIK